MRYSYDTIRYLVSHCPGVHFVWIMGADNLRSFHRWQKWRGIAGMVPIVVIDRLGPSLYAMGSVCARALGRQRVPESAAASLPFRRPPAWVFLHGLEIAAVVRPPCGPFGSRKSVVNRRAKYKLWCLRRTDRNGRSRPT